MILLCEFSYTHDDLDKIAEDYLQENEKVEREIIQDFREEEEKLRQAKLLKEEQDHAYQNSLKKDQEKIDPKSDTPIDINERREKAASAAEKRRRQNLSGSADTQSSSTKKSDSNFEDDFLPKRKPLDDK